MCGRYVSPEQSAIERAWRIGRTNSNPFPRRYNVQPTTMVPMLLFDAGELALAAARWGLIPYWWKQEKPPKFTFNARLEEAASKPMWREPLRSGRCLLPAEGWYEWREMERADPRTGEIVRTKQPHYIRRHDGRPFCFAGLMSSRAEPGTSDALFTCAILTAAAAGPVAEVHDRMPVVLSQDAHTEWLDPALKDTSKAGALARARTMPDAFTHFPVRQLVNSARNEGPELIEPAEEV